jgi:hypothetical protein
MPQLTAAQQSAIILLTAAAGDDDTCATEAAAVATDTVDARVLVGFSILECALSWSPGAADEPAHPIFGPALRSLRAGEAGRVRELLVEAFTGRDAGAYATLLVQFSYLARELVPNLTARLQQRGVLLATDPDAAANRPAGALPDDDIPGLR